MNEQTKLAERELMRLAERLNNQGVLELLERVRTARIAVDTFWDTRKQHGCLYGTAYYLITGQPLSGYIDNDRAAVAALFPEYATTWASGAMTPLELELQRLDRSAALSQLYAWLQAYATRKGIV